MAKANAKDGDLRCSHQFLEMINGVLAMSWIARSVGDENAIKMVSNLVNGIVIRERCDAGAAADQASKDVFLDTAIDNGDMEITIEGTDMERRLGANLVNQIDLLRIDESFILVCVIFLTDGYASQGRPLLSKVRHNCARVDTYSQGQIPLVPKTRP